MITTTLDSSITDDYTIMYIAPEILFILLVVDVIILFYMLFSNDQRFKKYSNFFLLFHGTIPFIGKIASMLTIPPLLTLLTIIIIFCMYLILTDNDIIYLIIITFNTITMAGIIIQTIIGVSTLAKIFKAIIFSITCFMILVLALKRQEKLYKTHLILVCYIVLAFLIDLKMGSNILKNGEKSNVEILVSVIFLVICMIGLIFTIIT
ncbi:hypothetical protein NAPIS_ORF01304 [Vairimorpha apis BRL 01]|uniref:Uncharacterized protein n=1 Tax=Vairimorpha apis BRL 01 TaxID=1037528 RepID=T0L0N1_9MICR|nr:hypothetical protein NAPIS_ORF01304 [Vairimorpha apis BRL 01]